MKKEFGLIINTPTKKASKKEIEERKEKVRKLLAKWIAQEIFRRNGLEIDMNEVELWYASQQADFKAKASKRKKRLWKHGKNQPCKVLILLGVIKSSILK